MKNIIRSFIAGVLLLFASSVSAMDVAQDPNGFADLQLGATVEDIQSSHQTKFLGYQSGTAAYHIYVPDAHGSVYFSGPVVVRGVFTNNRLSSVIIAFSQETIPQRVVGMKKLLGNYELNQGVYTWKGPFSTIFMLRMNGKGMIAISSNEYNNK